MEKALVDILDEEMAAVRDINYLNKRIKITSDHRIDILMDDCDLAGKELYLKNLQDEIDRLNDEKVEQQRKLVEVRLELKSYFMRNILN